MPPSIGETVEEVFEVIVNRSVTLECPAVGHPQPDIQWFKDGSPLPLNGRQHKCLK